MRIALGQINPIVGDVAGNAQLVLDAVEKARAQKADLLVTTELGLIGYPPRDLLFRRGVVEACEAAVLEIARHAGDMVVLVGHPRRVAGGIRPFRNSVSAVSGGRVIAVYDKRLLPGYDVFDEDRYFDPGRETCVIDVRGRKIGILLCEDMWRAQDVTAECRYPVEPVSETARRGCDVLAVLNGSPFILGKWKRHVEQLGIAARMVKRPIVSVNQVGANDDLIFDGRSVVIDTGGAVRHQLPGWTSAVNTIDLHDEAMGLQSHGFELQGVSVDPMDELYNALVLGVRDYCRKTGHERVFIGLSGGIDSALTAVIAAAALGPANVTGVLMPSRFTADISNEDARALSRNLGLGPCEEISIQQMHEAARSTLRDALGKGMDGVTDENVQTRLRGIALMALTNARGGLVLATGNKSELATGYCTIYGDMCGALAVLGDVVKTRVYELSRWINANFEPCGFVVPPIPQRSITRVPTAELRPDQTDQDTLPPYDVLDQIIMRYVEQEQSAEQIIAETRLDAALVRKWTRWIDREQYKRDQAAIVLKVTGRTFGRGRPMPIAMKQSGS